LAVFRIKLKAKNHLRTKAG